MFNKNAIFSHIYFVYSFPLVQLCVKYQLYFNFNLSELSEERADLQIDFYQALTVFHFLPL